MKQDDRCSFQPFLAPKMYAVVEGIHMFDERPSDRSRLASPHFAVVTTNATALCLHQKHNIFDF